ncbi:MAG: hypothetical protein PHC61_15755 [Chitinivibrionales bacterium]|nr:hypothetical protein [Chitinivibrionales bacterium]
MKKAFVLFAAVGIMTGVLFSCSDNPSGASNTNPPHDTTGTIDTSHHDSTVQLDTTVRGKWAGAMGAITLIHFHGEKIFVNISGSDSTFALITRDTLIDTTLNSSIKDTTLVLTGKWRLKPLQDSILLLCESGRIIDTTLHALVSRDSVAGQRIPMNISIYRNSQLGTIEWKVILTDLIPLAPYLHIDLSTTPLSVLQVIQIILVKKSQI